MAASIKGKRTSRNEQPHPAKRRKLSHSSKKISKHNGHQTKEKSKGKAFEQEIIPIPAVEEPESLDHGMDEDEEYGGGAAFLDNLDEKGIAQSKRETERLHRLVKPVRQKPKLDDLPSIDSHDEDYESWSSGIEEDAFSDAEESSAASDSSTSSPADDMDSDEEMPYEKAPRKLHQSWSAGSEPGVQRLPIKLANGLVQSSGRKAVVPVDDELEESSSDEEASEVLEEDDEAQRMHKVSTGARFGRLAVADVVGNKSRTARIQGAKEQIAGICQDIIADPENSLGLLRRLHAFSLAEIPTAAEPVPNDPMIRKLSILSQLAVFKDVIPGYRIRPLSDKEKAEKVSQTVSHTREWEQGLVVVYQTFLRLLETEVKAKSELADVALKCMCTLATEVTHFNFRANLLSCIVARLSKKTWDASCEMALTTLTTIFHADLTGVPSLEIVQLLNKMIKDRHFKIHPAVLSCLLHLRLKTELSARASESKADKEDSRGGGGGGKRFTNQRAAARRAKGKATGEPYLSKKSKKAMKEKKEIEREFKEAEAEVDKEERAVTQTETLKLLFVLYFRILKNPRPTPLLPAALQGISKFAHLVNVDFFKDLLNVLKNLISLEREESDDIESAVSRSSSTLVKTADIHCRLLCIVTAFELLSGQGEALSIDLSDFVTNLYSMILPLGLMPDIESSSPLHPTAPTPTPTPTPSPTIADMLFRALSTIFSSRTHSTSSPSYRSAAFSKRLLGASLHWPPTTTLRTIEFVRSLVARDPKLEALLSTADRTFDGVYHPDVDDPQLCNPFGSLFWELHLLREQHCDQRVKKAAASLLNFTRS